MKYPPPIPGLLLGALFVAIVCAIECWVFVWMYRKINKTPEGRHLYRLSILLGLTFTLTVGFQFLPDSAVAVFIAAVVQLLIFLAVCAELWVRIMLLVENQRKRKARLLSKTSAPEDEFADPPKGTS